MLIDKDTKLCLRFLLPILTIIFNCINIFAVIFTHLSIDAYFITVLHRSMEALSNTLLIHLSKKQTKKKKKKRNKDKIKTFSAQTLKYRQRWNRKKESVKRDLIRKRGN